MSKVIVSVSAVDATMNFHQAMVKHHTDKFKYHTDKAAKLKEAGKHDAAKQQLVHAKLHKKYAVQHNKASKLHSSILQHDTAKAKYLKDKATKFSKLGKDSTTKKPVVKKPLTEKQKANKLGAKLGKIENDRKKRIDSRKNS